MYDPNYDRKLTNWSLADKEMIFNEDSLIVGIRKFKSTPGSKFYKKLKYFTEIGFLIYL